MPPIRFRGPGPRFGNGDAQTAQQPTFDITCDAVGQSAVGAATLEERFDLTVAAVASSGQASATLEERFDISVAAVASQGVASVTAEERFDLSISAIASSGVASIVAEERFDVNIAAIANPATSVVVMEFDAFVTEWNLDIAATAPSGFANATAEVDNPEVVTPYRLASATSVTSSVGPVRELEPKRKRRVVQSETHIFIGGVAASGYATAIMESEAAVEATADCWGRSAYGSAVFDQDECEDDYLLALIS